MPDLKATLAQALNGHWSIRVTVELHGNVHVARHICHCGESYSSLSEHLADVLLAVPGVAVVDAEVYRVARKGLVDLTKAWAELRMDTPEDQSLHDRLVALSRTAADLLPLPREASGE